MNLLTFYLKEQSNNVTRVDGFFFGLYIVIIEFNFNIINMKIHFWFALQIGLMLSVGEQYEKRKYLTIEIPFLIIQILWFKPPKKLN